MWICIYGPLENKIYKLHKLYVLPAEQGKGTGKALIEFIINDIKSKNARALRLNVNRYNNARSFYERLNFKIISTEDIDIGNGFFMNDYIMELKIQAAL
jgi:diamine N-acetyltransferase